MKPLHVSLDVPQVAVDAVEGGGVRVAMVASEPYRYAAELAPTALSLQQIRNVGQRDIKRQASYLRVLPDVAIYGTRYLPVASPAGGGLATTAVGLVPPQLLAPLLYENAAGTPTCIESALAAVYVAGHPTFDGQIPQHRPDFERLVHSHKIAGAQQPEWLWT